METVIEPNEDGIAIFDGMAFRGCIVVCDTRDPDEAPDDH